MFFYCRSLETIDTSFLDENYTGVTNVSYMFRYCEKLKEIDLTALKTGSINNAANMFQNCIGLTNVIFESNCFSNSSVTTLDFSYSPLTHDCAVDIFNKLATRTNSPVLKLNTVTKNKLTDAEKTIATNKGWLVS